MREKGKRRKESSGYSEIDSNPHDSNGCGRIGFVPCFLDLHAAMAESLPCSRIPFLQVSKCLEACSLASKQPLKAQKLEIFRTRNIEPIRAHADDLFQVYRLLCPDVRLCKWPLTALHKALTNSALYSSQKDSRRYSVKEAMLARRMGAACGLADNSPDVDAAINWRTQAVAMTGGGRSKGGSKRSGGLLTGNFVAVLHMVSTHIGAAGNEMKSWSTSTSQRPGFAPKTLNSVHS